MKKVKLAEDTEIIKYNGYFCGTYHIKGRGNTVTSLEVQPITQGSVLIENMNYDYLYIHDLYGVDFKNVKAKILVLNNAHALDGKDIEYNDIYCIENPIFNSTQGTIMFNGSIYSLKNNLQYCIGEQTILNCLGDPAYEKLRSMLFQQIQHTI